MTTYSHVLHDLPLEVPVTTLKSKWITLSQPQ